MYSRFLIPLYCCLLLSMPAFSEDMESGGLPAQILVENLKGVLAAAGNENVRKMTPLGLELIEVFETWRPKPSNDAANYCTIGFGHILALQPCEQIDTGKYTSGLTPEDGLALLESDSRYARIAVERLTERYLNDDQFSAVSVFVFSIGSEKFEGSSMLSMINQGDLSGAASQFGNWTKMGGKVVPSLVARRACERMLYVSELKAGTDGKINAKDCK